MRTIVTLFLFAAIIAGCANTEEPKDDKKPAQAEKKAADKPKEDAAPAADDAKAPSHDNWTALLQKHVSAEGVVNYDGFRSDREALRNYLNELMAVHPSASWSPEEIKAYWINVYNAFTIDMMLNYDPIKSIMDIKEDELGAWDIPFVNITDQTYTLNDVEKGILLKDFDEPRIHFAVVCASFSCPKLLNEAYTADRLEEQLQAQSVAFLNDPKRNQISENDPQVSELFNWYASDFTKGGGTVIDFINQYAETKVNSGATLNFIPYDWSPNNH